MTKKNKKLIKKTKIKSQNISMIAAIKQKYDDMAN